jgi:hypothetical protein
MKWPIYVLLFLRDDKTLIENNEGQAVLIQVIQKEFRSTFVSCRPDQSNVS